MKRIRKITVVTLMISMLASLLPMPSLQSAFVSKPIIAAESSETQKESGNYRYTVKTDGTVKITGFNGTKKYISIPQTIEGKKELLHSKHIALWDVIASCEIKGSSDSSIKNVTPNDLSKIYVKSFKIPQLSINLSRLNDALAGLVDGSFTAFLPLLYF